MNKHVVYFCNGCSIIGRNWPITAFFIGAITGSFLFAGTILGLLALTGTWSNNVYVPIGAELAASSIKAIVATTWTVIALSMVYSIGRKNYHETD